MPYDNKLMIKVANIYYKQGLKQGSVARKLKISKYQVNRILKEAVNCGIVQINIVDPLLNNFHLTKSQN